MRRGFVRWRPCPESRMRDDRPSLPLRQLAALKSGDEQALKALWQDWAGKVQVFARLQLAPCGAEAEPLAQEVTADVFLDLWRHPDRYDGRVAFGTWLLTLARNKAVDRLRQRRLGATLQTDLSDAAWQALPDDAPTPPEALARQQRRRGVLDCLRRLGNALQREALMLWALEDMPLQDIARLQNTPENTVKTRLFHGRRHLRDCLQQEAEGPRGAAP